MRTMRSPFCGKDGGPSTWCSGTAMKEAQASRAQDHSVSCSLCLAVATLDSLSVRLGSCPWPPSDTPRSSGGPVHYLIAFNKFPFRSQPARVGLGTGN